MMYYKAYLKWYVAFDMYVTELLNRLSFLGLTNMRTCFMVKQIYGSESFMWVLSHKMLPLNFNNVLVQVSVMGIASSGNPRRPCADMGIGSGNMDAVECTAQTSQGAQCG